MLKANELSEYLNPTPSGDPIIDPLAVQDNGWGDLADTMIQSSLASGLEAGNRYKGGTEYDATMNEMADQGELRGQMQSGWQKIRRGALSRTSSIMPKVIQGIGHVGGFIGDLGRMVTGNVDYSDPNDYLKYTFDNALVEEMSQWDEGMNETVMGFDTRIYNIAKYTSGSLLDQMATPEFWARDFFDGAAFLASALVPGMAAGKLAKVVASGKALKMGEAVSTQLKNISAGKRMGEIEKILSTGKANGVALSAKELESLRSIVKGVQGMTVKATTAYNTISEAGFEAFDTGRQLRDELAQKRYGEAFEDLPEFWKDQIRKEIAPRQAETFLWNAGILAAPNYIQSKFFFGTPSDAKQVVKSALSSGITETEELSKHLAKNYVKSGWKNIGGSVLKGVASEGLWEEGIQSAIQDYESRKGRGLTDSNQVSGILDSYLTGFTTTEGQKAMVLGSLLGGLGGTFGGFKDWRYKQKDSEYVQGKVKENFERMLKVRTQYQNNISKNVTGVDADGNPIYSEEALLRSIYNTMHDTTKFTEALVSNLKGDNLHAGFVNAEALSELAFKKFSNPLFDTLEEAEESLNMDLENIAKQDGTENIHKILEEHRKTISSLKNIFKEVNDAVPTIENLMESEDGKLVPDSEKSDFAELVRTNLFYERVKKDYLERNVPRDKNPQEFDGLMSDIAQRIKDLQDRKKRTELLKEFKQYKDEFAQYRATLTKQDATEDEKSEARYELNKRKFLNGDEHTAESLYLQGSELLESRMKRKVPEGKRVLFMKAMQGVAKDTLQEAAMELREGAIQPSDFLAKIKNSFPFITPDLADEFTQSVQDVLDKRGALSDELNALDLSDYTDMMRYSEINAELDKINQMETELAEIKESSKDAGDVLEHVNAAFANNEVAEMEEGVYAANFTDDNGTNMPAQAEKLLSQLNKDPDKIIADEGQIIRVIEAFKAQIALFKKESRKDLLNSEQFKFFSNEYLKSLARVYPELVLGNGYIQDLETVVSALQTLHTLVKDTKDSRFKRQQEAYALDSEVKFRGLGILQDGTFSDQETEELLNQVVGKEKMDSILKEARANNMEAPYAEFILEEFKRKAGPEQLNKFIDLLDKRKNATKQSVVALTGHTEKVVERYLERPSQRILDMLSGHLSSPEDYKNPASVIYKFEKTKSFSEFLRFLGTDTSIPTDRKQKINQLAGIHKELLGIEEMFNVLDSGISYSELVQEDAKNLEEDQKAAFLPTYQQLTAIRAIIQFLKTPVSNTDLSAFCTLLGRAGTGKTTVVLQRVFRQLGVKPEQVVVSATNPNAVKTISDALAVKGLEFETMLNQDLTGKRILILDEAAAISPEDFRKLTKKVVDHNKKVAPGEVIRVVFAGDPNQITYSGSIAPMISKVVTEVDGVDYGSIRKIPPLTIAYRSDVGAITAFADEFLDNMDEVKEAFATASDSIELLNDNTLGVHTDSADKIVGIANQLFKGSAGKSQIGIIVESMEAKARYQGKVPIGVEILTFEESQGRTLDKVLIDIRKSNLPDTVNEYNYNRIMYTALTRARYYVFVANSTGAFKQTVDKTTSENKEARSKDISSNAEWYYEHIRKEETILNELSDNKISPKNTTKTQGSAKPEVKDTPEGDENLELFEEEMAKEEDQQQQEQEEANPEPASEPTEDDHVLEFPENMGASVVGNLLRGGRVKYVSVFIRDTRMKRIIVFAETLSGKFMRVGYLKTFDGLEQSLPKASKDKLKGWESKEAMSIDSLADLDLEFAEKELEAAALHEGTLKEASKITYSYTGKRDFGTGLLNRLMALWRKGFTVNGDKKVNARVHIYSDKELTSLRLDREKFGHLKAGVPYLILESEGFKDLQYIELSPAPINKETQGVKELEQFMQAFSVLEESGIGKYGDAELNKAIRYFHRNFSTSGKGVEFKSHVVTIEEIKKFLPNITQEQFETLQEQVHRIIPAYYGVGQRQVVLPRKEAEERFHDDPATGVTFRFEERKNGNVAVLKQEKGENKFIPYEIEQLVGGLGRAQWLISDLAHRHPSITLGGHVPLIRGNRVTSLLSEEDSFENRGYEAIKAAYKKHLMQNEGLTAYEAYARMKGLSGETIEAHYLNTVTNPEDRKGMEDYFNYLKNNEVSTNLNMAVLKEILTFDEQGNHGLLQQNLRMSKFNNMGKNIEKSKDALDSLLASVFSGVTPSRVVVAPAKTEEKQDQEQEQAQAPEANNQDDYAPDFGSEEDSGMLPSFFSRVEDSVVEDFLVEEEEFRKFIEKNNICI